MTVHARTVVFLAFDGMKTLDVVGPAEAFAEASRHGGHYRLVYCSPDGRPVRTSIGTEFPVDLPASEVDSAHTVIISGGDDLVSRPIDPGLTLAASTLAARSTRVASICTGAFILAETGLLNGRRATTHWHHAHVLARGYPEIDVEPDAIFVRDGNVYTSAGVSAGIDLALALIEADLGADAARAVARELVVYLQRAGNQSQFSAALAAPPPSASVLRRVTDAVNADPSAEHSLASLAHTAAVSSRHLTRLFQRELGTTPAKYVEMIRFDLAKGILDAGESVTSAAIRSGFGSPETLRRVFVSRIGIPPSTYQNRFLTSG